MKIKENGKISEKINELTYVNDMWDGFRVIINEFFKICKQANSWLETQLLTLLINEGMK